MQISKSEEVKGGAFSFIKGARLISGFVLAPTLGAPVVSKLLSS